MVPDDLREDNTRYLAVRVRKALQVLLVSDSDETDQRSAAFYISHALVPSPEAVPGFNLLRRHGQEADRGVLETADVFVLVAPAILSGEATEIISRRVKDGAGLMVFLDGPTSPLLRFPALNPPFQLQRAVVSSGGDLITQGMAKVFQDIETGAFSRLRFYRHYQNAVLTGRDNEVLLSIWMKFSSSYADRGRARDSGVC